MDTDHEIDVAVAAVETELQIEREKRERENNSKTAETPPNSKTGSIQVSKAADNPMRVYSEFNDFCLTRAYSSSSSTGALAFSFSALPFVIKTVSSSLM